MAPKQSQCQSSSTKRFVCRRIKQWSTSVPSNTTNSQAVLPINNVARQKQHYNYQRIKNVIDFFSIFFKKAIVFYGSPRKVYWKDESNAQKSIVIFTGFAIKVHYRSLDSSFFNSFEKIFVPLNKGWNIPNKMLEIKNFNIMFTYTNNRFINAKKPLVISTDQKNIKMEAAGKAAAIDTLPLNFCKHWVGMIGFAQGLVELDHMYSPSL